MTHPHPPPGWLQRVGPHPPLGRDGERFEVYMDAEPGAAWARYEINLHTCEVFEARAGGWRAPGWLELPPRVRARVWTLWRG